MKSSISLIWKRLLLQLRTKYVGLQREDTTTACVLFCMLSRAKTIQRFATFPSRIRL
jgi:hypothetical protein